MAGEIEKRYWTVGEVAEIIGVACSAVRFWTQEFGLDSKLKRSRSHNNRLYTAADVETIREIHRLLTVELYTIPGAKRQLELAKPSYWVGKISPTTNPNYCDDNEEIENVLNPMP